MKKKLISLFLSICFLAGLLPSIATVAHAASDLPNVNGANGSELKPYIINEASDFTWIITNHATYSWMLQTADIDLTGFSWAPIGDNASPFSGHYNGNGYTISNMSVNNGSLSYMGMFGYTSNAAIKNVTLANATFAGGTSVNQAAIGAIAGMSTGTTVVEHCRVIGSSSITGDTNDTIGGVVGSNGAAVKYCSSSAAVSSGNYDTGSAPNTGGIVGSNWGGTIENCFSSGTVHGGTGTSVGGIVGFCYSAGSQISNCYSTGTVSGDASTTGAIVGKVEGTHSISGNYYLTGSASNGIGSGAVAGDTVTAAAAAALKTQATYTGWDFSGNVWLLAAGENDGYPFLKGVATVAPTSAATSLTMTSAVVSGSVLLTGHGTVSERGVEYTKASESNFTKVAASGDFSVSLTGLAPQTQYYARAYAINEVGIAYGEPIVFTTNAPAPGMTLSVSPGDAVGATKSVITDTATDHFAVNITDTSVGPVEAGSALPASGANLVTPYTSGSDITLGTAVGKYLQIYDVDSGGKIVKMNEVLLNIGHIRSADLSLPYLENFEGGVNLPGDWITESIPAVPQTVMWSNTAATILEDSTATPVVPFSGSSMAKADFYSCEGGTASRLSLGKSISLPANNTYELSFYMFHSTVADYGLNDSIQPQISTDRGATWQNLGTAAIKRINGTVGWEKHSFILGPYAATTTLQIGFLGVSDYGYSAFIDQLEVKVNGPAIAVTAGGGTTSVYGAADSRSFSITDSNFAVVPTEYTAVWCNSNGTTAAAPSAGTLVVGTVTDGDAPLTLTTSPTADAGTYYFKVSSGDTSVVTAYTITKATADSAMTTVNTSVSNLGKTGAAVTLPALPSGASYGTPSASGIISITDMSISGSTLTYTAPASTPAQTGTVTIRVTGAVNYSDYDITVTVTSVAKTEVSITGIAAAQGLVYNGAPQSGYTGTAAVTDHTDLNSALVYTYTSTDGAGYHQTTPPTAAGAYRLTVSVPESNELYTGSASVDFTVAKAPVSFTVSNYTFAYDESPHTAAVAQTAGQLPSAAGKFSVTYRKGAEAATASQTSVGAYDIIVTLNDDNLVFAGQADAIRSLTLADNLIINTSAYSGAVTLPAASSVAYGQTLADSTLTGGDSKGTFAWKDPAAVPTVNNTGYTVVFTPTDTNYSPVEKTVPLTVTPKEVTVLGASAMDRIYDGSTTVTVSGGTVSALETADIGKVTLVDTGASGTVASANIGSGKAVSVTGYVLNGTAAGNYALIQPTDVTVTITSRDVSVDAGSYTVTKVYDSTADAGTGSGALHTGDILTSDTMIHLVPGIIPAYSGTDVRGDYILTLPISLSGNDNGNYTLKNTTVAVTGAITPQSVAVTVDSIDAQDYTGAQISVTPVVRIGGTVFSVSQYTVEQGENTDAGTNAGRVTVKAIPGGNYAFQDVTVYFTINKAVLTVTGAQAAARPYDGTAVVAMTGGTLSGVKAADTGKVALEQTAAGLAVDPNAGSDKTVTVSGYTLSGDKAKNYNLTQPTDVKVTITARALAWDTTGLSSAKPFDGTLNAPITGELKLSGVVGTDDLGFTYDKAATTAAYADANVGADKTAAVTVANARITNSNYALPTAAPTFTGTITPVKEISAPAEEEPHGYQMKLVMEDTIDSVPAAITAADPTLSTPAAVENKLKTNIESVLGPDSSVSVNNFDLVLWVSQDSGTTWAKATVDNFPTGGITVVIPWSDLGITYEQAQRMVFTVTHMFSASVNGHAPGTTEMPAWTVTADGLRFTVAGLSPMAVAYKALPVVTYDAGGGSETGVGYTAQDGKLSSLPTPTRSGYTFGGWYTAAVGGEKVTTDTVFSADATVYAHWTQDAGAAPATGDSTSPALWVSLLGMGLLGLTAAAIWRRRKEARTSLD